MKRVRLVHWNEVEGKERAKRLRGAGYEVVYEAMTPEVLKKLRNDPPVAVVIDLTRLPSHGRDVGVGLRYSKSTRHVPLVFVDGDPAKVARIKELLPDAVYTGWRGIRGALKQAIAHPPANPVVPRSGLGAYSGTPLVKKLGIKTGARVALIGAPGGFEKTLGALPEGVTLLKQARGRPDLTIWFAKSRRELERRIERMAAMAATGGLWIAWRKKASGTASDLSGDVVRRRGLGAGLVDFKVCAIDDTWSGLLFTRRKGK